MTEEQINEIKQRYHDFFEGILMLQKYNELLDQYLADAMAGSDAMVKAEEEAMKWIKADSEIQTAIDAMVEQQVGGLTSTYYEGIVNKGESLIYTSGTDGSQSGWSDWSKVVAERDTSMVYDNYPIEAFSDYAFDGLDAYASIESLDAIKAAIQAGDQSFLVPL